MGNLEKYLFSKNHNFRFTKIFVVASYVASLLLSSACTSSGFGVSNQLSSVSAMSLSLGSQSVAKYMGINLGGVGDYSPQFFADAIKSARYWGPPATPCWGTDPSPTLDANGWPEGDTGICAVSYASNLEVGDYELSFTGQATVKNILDANITVVGVAYNASTNTTTGKIHVVSGATQMMLTFTNTRRLPTDTVATGITNVRLMRPGQSSNIFSQLMLDRLQSVSTMRFMDALATNGTTQSTWSQRRLPNYSLQHGDITGISWEYVILLANQTGKDVWINIPDLATEDYVTNLAKLFKYGSDANGNVYSSTQSNPVYPPINPGIKVYMEYGNELWNWMFAATTRNYNRAKAGGWTSGTKYAVGDAVNIGTNSYVCTTAITSSTSQPSGTGQNIVDGGGTWAYFGPYPQNLALGSATPNLWDDGYRFVADRIVRISNIFRTQFGDAAMGTQILPVLASQYVYGDVFRQQLVYLEEVYGPFNTYGNPQVPVNHYVYGLAGAPYYSIPSLSSTPWPTSCALSMATCTSYVPTTAYAAKAYVTSNGKLYRAATAISAGWKTATAYSAGTMVVSNGNLYKCTTSIASSSTAPSGTASSIVDGSGTWAYQKTVSSRAAPSATTSGVADGDGTWNYLYTYGDTTAETNQAFIDLDEQIDVFRSGAGAGSDQNVFVGHAATYGLVPLAYEGGLDTSGAVNFTSLVTSTAFQNDSRMTEVTDRFYNMWFAGGGKVINYYALAGLYGQYGTWGLTTSLGNPETTRMEAFVAEATMGVMPSLSAGNVLPSTLTITSPISGSCYTSGARFYFHAGSTTDYEEYVVSSVSGGTYTLTTNVYSGPLRIVIDEVNVMDLAVGTGKSITFKLSAGVHSIVTKDVPSSNVVASSYDPLVITQ